MGCSRGVRECLRQAPCARCEAVARAATTTPGPVSAPEAAALALHGHG
ncbi:hypothetical protein ACIBJC_31250 [Streptomyces sp. NPDC050509]